jgi:curved DNA-binding protein CbpA
MSEVSTPTTYTGTLPIETLYNVPPTFSQIQQASGEPYGPSESTSLSPQYYSNQMYNGWNGFAGQQLPEESGYGDYNANGLYGYPEEGGLPYAGDESGLGGMPFIEDGVPPQLPLLPLTNVPYPNGPAQQNPQTDGAQQPAPKPEPKPKPKHHGGGGLFGAISGAISGVAHAVGGAVNKVAHVAGDVVHDVGKVTGKIEQGVIDVGSDVAGGALKAVGLKGAGDAVEHAGHDVGKFVYNVNDKVSGFTGDVVKGVGDGADGLIEGVGGIIAHPIETVKGLASLGFHAAALVPGIGTPLLMAQAAFNHESLADAYGSDLGYVKNTGKALASGFTGALHKDGVGGAVGYTAFNVAAILATGGAGGAADGAVEAAGAAGEIAEGTSAAGELTAGTAAADGTSAARELTAGGGSTAGETGGTTAGGTTAGGTGGTTAGGTTAGGTGGTTAGGTTAGGTGGATTGGATDGAAPGGAANGGATSGGTATDGAAPGGGTATDGAAPGGANTDGAAPGGGTTAEPPPYSTLSQEQRDILTRDYSRPGWETQRAEQFQAAQQALGVDEYSTPAEIQQAYRNFARELHPDSFSGDPEGAAAAQENFKSVSNAYSILKNDASWADRPSSLEDGAAQRAAAQAATDNGAAGAGGAEANGGPQPGGVNGNSYFNRAGQFVGRAGNYARDFINNVQGRFAAGNFGQRFSDFAGNVQSRFADANLGQRFSDFAGNVQGRFADANLGQRFGDFTTSARARFGEFYNNFSENVGPYASRAWNSTKNYVGHLNQQMWDLNDKWMADIKDFGNRFNTTWNRYGSNWGHAGADGAAPGAGAAGADGAAPGAGAAGADAAEPAANGFEAPLKVPTTRDEALQTLGLGPDASPTQIHSAYLKSIRQWHPDTIGDGPGAQFATQNSQAINVAKDLLA